MPALFCRIETFSKAGPNKPSFPPNAMFAPTFHCLLAQGAAACPQCVWNEVLAGLTEEDTRSRALMALVTNPFLNFCSFAGPLQISRAAKVSQSCSHQILCCFFFYGSSVTGKSMSMQRFLSCRASFGGSGMQ